MGVIGISYNDYMMMPFRMINAIAIAHREHEQVRFQADWERARLISFFATDPQNAKRAKNVQGLVKFPWDNKPTSNGMGALRKHLESLHSEQFRKLDKKIAEHG